MRYRAIPICLTVSLISAVNGFAQDVRDTPGRLEQRATLVTAEANLPRRIVGEPMVYPLELRRIGGEAAIIFQITLNDTGRVAEIRKTQGPVVRSAVGPLQDDAAAREAAATAVERVLLASLKTLRFERPAQQAPVTFALSFGFVAGDLRIALTAPDTVLAADATPVRWAALPGTVRVGGPVKPPVQINKVPPVYPREAQSEKVQGVVIMEAVIGENGRVKDARVLRSVPKLDLAALAAVVQWVYEPALVDGKPTPVVMTVTASFTLN